MNGEWLEPALVPWSYPWCIGASLEHILSVFCNIYTQCIIPMKSGRSLAVCSIADINVTNKCEGCGQIVASTLKGCHDHPNFVSLSVRMPDDDNSITEFKGNVPIEQNTTNAKLPNLPHSDLHNIFQHFTESISIRKEKLLLHKQQKLN